MDGWMDRLETVAAVSPTARIQASASDEARAGLFSRFAARGCHGSVTGLSRVCHGSPSLRLRVSAPEWGDRRRLSARLEPTPQDHANPGHLL
jgi:hypothetical protein